MSCSAALTLSIARSALSRVVLLRTAVSLFLPLRTSIPETMKKAGLLRLGRRCLALYLDSSGPDAGRERTSSPGISMCGYPVGCSASRAYNGRKQDD
jgi:hypothetical protein